MFLDLTIRRNPRLIQVATDLHQRGLIPANTFLVDLDMISKNARELARESRRTGIALYFMSKHFNRNPLVSHAIVTAGIPSAVAVNVDGARYLARYGIPVGHVGHLVQIPKHEIPFVLKLRPEVWTVFSREAAKFISDAAHKMGLVQDVLIRVRDNDDIIYPNEEGGINVSEFTRTVEEFKTYKGIRVVGVVTFPATLYNEQHGCGEPTSNFGTILRAADILRRMNIEVKQINAPGATSFGMLEVIKANGGTHGEPGHAITGTTPWLLFDDHQPERPAMVYVNEISHIYENMGYLFGGGFFACDVGDAKGKFDPFRMKTEWVPNALVGSHPEDILENKLPLDKSSFFGRTSNAIDWYGALFAPPGAKVKVGDTVVSNFRTQGFATRSHLAVVAGIQSSSPKVMGIFDQSGNILDEDWNPMEEGMKTVASFMEEIGERYKEN